MLAFEQPRERLFPSLDHDAITHPLPELSLCCPKLFPILAYDECCLFFPLLLRAHCEYTSTLAYLGHTQKTPWGSLSREAASNFQLRTEFPAPVATIFRRSRRVCNSALLKELSGRSLILS